MFPRQSLGLFPFRRPRNKSANFLLAVFPVPRSAGVRSRTNPSETFSSGYIDANTFPKASPELSMTNCASPSQPEPAKLPKKRLLYFDRRSSICELLLDGLRFVLGDAFFHGLGRSVHQILGFFQAEAGDFPYRFDNVDLISADFFQN